MGTRIRHWFILPGLMICLAISGGQTMAQTFTNLDNFTGSLNDDGEAPCGALILSGGTLYGTTYYGGTNYEGTVFAINTNGKGYNRLHSFNSDNISDGTYPYLGNLAQSGSKLYGMTFEGGTNGVGMVFAIATNGTGFTNLYSFTAAPSPSYINNDGALPYSSTLALSSGGTLYGAATWGGTNGTGTIFAINTNGADFTVLHYFSLPVYNGNDSFTNSEGAYPEAGLILSGGILYGTTYQGGTNGGGTVFAISTNGGPVTVLHAFGAVPDVSPYTNSDGAYFYSGLMLSGGTLYGTATSGGTNGSGTIFSLNTNGTSFSLLHTFPALVSGSNSDGAYPYMGSLILSGNTLYGTASGGGPDTNGTVFAINTDGADFTVLHAFTLLSSDTNRDGATPYGGLILSSNTLYGTAVYGGAYGDGTLFGITLPPPSLSLALFGKQLVLMWPTNVNSFTLQSATNPLSPVVWSAVSPAPVIVNGQYTVTNAVSGREMIYRLIQ